MSFRNNASFHHDKRAAIVQIAKLGDQVHSAMRAGWL
jgi:hypothetical protein